MSDTKQTDPHSPSTGQTVLAGGSVPALAAADAEAAWLDHQYLFTGRRFCTGGTISLC